MEIFKIENLSFTYPDRQYKALCEINLTINSGDFITVCGKSGCGKTTLLRMLKSTLAPCGKISGEIWFNGNVLSQTDKQTQVSQIGFVMQNPDNQIVTDKVWHELAFGLESLGYDTSDIRARVSEMASFFGIQTWFHKNVNELSGGQKQLLNLASVMAMQPKVLILDEPTSQLDPIAAHEFIKTLERINQEIGTTIILSEHRLEEAFCVSNRAVVMDNGEIIADGHPVDIANILKSQNHDMYISLPAPMRIYGEVEGGQDYPLNVRDGRCWLEEYAIKHNLNEDAIPNSPMYNEATNVAVEIKSAWFRYEKNMPDVIKGLDVKIGRGELFTIVGGNGTGKTTMLSLISGLNKPYRGEVYINGIKISNVNNLHGGCLCMLPQNPQALFLKKTVYLDLLDMLSNKNVSASEKDKLIKEISHLCRIENLLSYHPYDLSGGEQQRAALAKVLLNKPEILLLDEPTKGMDAEFKEIFASILGELKSNGVTIVMVSHDIEFCAEYADRCAMLFDGNITSIGHPRDFFAGKSFYTTSTNRMARKVLPGAVVANDVISACGIKCEKKKTSTHILSEMKKSAVTKNINTVGKAGIKPYKIGLAVLFAALFVASHILQRDLNTGFSNPWIQILSILSLAACFVCILPVKAYNINVENIRENRRGFTIHTFVSVLCVLVIIPLTVFIGFYYLHDRRYYFISMLIILEIMIPFFMRFERRKPKARELIIISVLCALAVAGRIAFNMLPQFKPIVAIVVISGICFGGETGFLVGAVSGFVSNFFFGQSPLTPWQMFGLGIIGFLAGVLFERRIIGKNKILICLFGAFATFFIYGLILNFASLILWQNSPTFDMFIMSCVSALPFDLVHAISTAFFLWFASEPVIEKLERVKKKYGLV